MEIEKFNAYVIVKTREGEKKQYAKTTQSFVDSIYDAKFYKSLAEAEKDRNIASFNYGLYMWMLHQPKYTFQVIAV